MYRTANGEEIFVIDGHTHFWDGSPANQKNVHGKQFIECFYGYHTALSPKEQLWPKDKFEKYSADDLYRDLFIDGPDDVAIVQSTYLKDFYKTGFNTIERNAEVAKRYPERFIVNGAFDPRDGEKALEYIHFLKETYDIKGVKMYTAEWNGASKGWKLTDPDAYKCFELCDKLGIRNIHVHKGPTIIPLSKDAFDVHVVIDFVGELGVENICWKMVRKGGQLFVVGYGGNINVPTAHLVIEEINIGGSLVGNFTELVELMELNADGKVKMHYTEYNLASINTALDDFKNRRFTGRGVIVP